MSTSLLVTAIYNIDADALFERASNFADIIESTRRISSYVGLPPVPMVEGQTYTTDITVFGLFRSSDYKIRVDRLSPSERLMITRESSDKVHSWQHKMVIETAAQGSVWTDIVAIDAGPMTPVVSRYARFMYLHRHRQRGALSAKANMCALRLVA